MVTRIIHDVRTGGWRTRAVAILAAVVVVLFAAIIVDGITSYNKIHSGVSVSGIDLGGLSRDEAAATLGAEIARAQESEILLTAPDKEWAVLPDDVGTMIDARGTAEAAFAVGRSDDVFHDLATRFSLYFSSREVPLQGTIDTVLLDHLISEVAATLDHPPVNAGLEVDGGTVKVIDGADGVVVDRDALRRELKGLLFTLHATELPVPMRTEPPAIQAANTADAVQQARTMISAEVSLRHDDASWTVTPDEIASFLDFTVEGEGADSRLVPFISAAKAEKLLARVADEIDTQPRNATWETNGETATLVPAKVGMRMDIEKTAAALTAAARSTTDRTAEVAGTEVQPDRTTEEAKAMGIVEKIGSYSTEFGGSASRRDNVQLAAKLINGTLLAPGEEFDFDTVVGQRTSDRGFKTAPVIVEGGRLEDALGGGICQVSTTLFNAVFFAGLDVTARTNHSIYISHYPKGRDATVSWGGPAFRFRNDTEHWILIKSASSRDSVLFVIYGTPVNRQVDYTTSDWYNIQPPTEKVVKNPELPLGERRVVDEGQTGRQIKVTRRVIEDGKTIHKDVFVSTYPMRPKIIEEGTKPAETTTTTKPSTTSTTKPPSTTTTEPEVSTTTTTP